MGTIRAGFSASVEDIHEPCHAARRIDCLDRSAFSSALFGGLTHAAPPAWTALQPRATNSAWIKGSDNVNAATLDLTEDVVRQISEIALKHSGVQNAIAKRRRRSDEKILRTGGQDAVDRCFRGMEPGVSSAWSYVFRTSRPLSAGS
ncbi:hypothetical protein [Bosea sp. AAP35]|uniref:hypothetical protein n=1 Tax=Bosea sp. AAP35 TaxID=1523417 RepID=UPI0012E2E448|nr:hypothetical protein [Bosea sp. AAP35]